MAREKELYRDTLERVRQLMDQQYPGQLTLSQEQAAKLIGVSARTLRNKGLTGRITCEQIANKFC